MISRDEPVWQRIMWVIELLVQERPRCVCDIVESTGWRRQDVDDACHVLIQDGRIRMLPDSFLTGPR